MDGVAKFNEFHGVSLSTNANNSVGAGSSNNAGNDSPSVNNINSNHGVMREQDRLMPIANVTRIMRTVLPGHAKISDDAKETIQECVSEYISFITSEANERCQQEKRKTITADDILCAMGKLGFDNYVEPLTLFLRRYREAEGNHRGSIHGEPLPHLKRTASAANLPPLHPTAPLAHPTALMAQSLAPAGPLELPPTAPMELPPAAPYQFPLEMASNAAVPPHQMSFYQQLGVYGEPVTGGGQYFGMPSYEGWGGTGAGAGAGAGTGFGDGAGASNSQSQHFPGAFDPHYFGDK